MKNKAQENKSLCLRSCLKLYQNVIASLPLVPAFIGLPLWKEERRQPVPILFRESNLLSIVRPVKFKQQIASPPWRIAMTKCFFIFKQLLTKRYFTNYYAILFPETP